MDKKTAYNLFEEMIVIASKKLVDFTLNSKFTVSEKADKSFVTGCDKEIDRELTKIAEEHNLLVVSEEGNHVLKIVKDGNYITIDPIDGTLGYIDYVNYALGEGDIKEFIKKDLGAEHDFCLLLGIVENGEPRFGCVYNYVTHEKILVDSQDKNNFVHENDKRKYNQENIVYLDQRFLEDPITVNLMSMEEVDHVRQASFGLKSIYTIINPHKNAITLHRVQSAGLWDVLPSAVAAKAFDGDIYDEEGETLRLTEYLTLPGRGAIVIKGEKFRFVLDRL